MDIGSDHRDMFNFSVIKTQKSTSQVSTKGSFSVPHRTSTQPGHITSRYCTPGAVTYNLWDVNRSPMYGNRLQR